MRRSMGAAGRVRRRVVRGASTRRLRRSARHRVRRHRRVAHGADGATGTPVPLRVAARRRARDLRRRRRRRAPCRYGSSSPGNREISATSGDTRATAAVLLVRVRVGATVRQLGVVPHQVVTAHTGVASPNLAGGLVTLGVLVVAALLLWRYRLGESSAPPRDRCRVDTGERGRRSRRQRQCERYDAPVSGALDRGSSVSSCGYRVRLHRDRRTADVCCDGSPAGSMVLAPNGASCGSRGRGSRPRPAHDRQRARRNSIETRPVGTSPSVAGSSPPVEHALHTTGNGHVLVAMADGAPLDVVAGLLLQLDRHGSPVVVEPTWGWPLGPQLVRHHERVTQTVTVVGPAQTAFAPP